MDCAIGAHAHGFAQCLLDGVQSHREDDGLAGPLFFIELQADFDGVTREVVHVELQSGFIDARTASTNLETRFGIRRALDANGDLHSDKR
jgi:hypothetical protein